MERRSILIRAIWALCLVAAGLNHARILFEHGLLWDYGGAALGSAIYWSSLTVIDPLVAALLFIRPRAGIICTAALIASNVVHNLIVTAAAAPDGQAFADAANPFLIAQIGFLVFVAATARAAWRGIPGPAA